MSRAPIITQKIRSEFGSLFLHVEFTPLGTPVKLRVSAPQKIADAQIGKLLDQVSEGFSGMLV